RIKSERLREVGQGSGRRVVIWDFQDEEREYLDSLKLDCQVHYVCPLDPQAVGIELGADVTDSEAKSLVDAYFGREPHLLTELVEPGEFRLKPSLTRAGEEFNRAVARLQAQGPWQFLDLLEACQDDWNLRLTLKLSVDGRRSLQGAKARGKGVERTLDAKLSQ